MTNDALLRALDDGSVEDVRAQLRTGAAPSDDALNTALQSSRDPLKKVELLSQHGVRASKRALAQFLADTLSSMGPPAATTWADAVRALLSLGAGVDARIVQDGGAPDWTPLLWALWRRDADVVDVLVAAGADVTLPSKSTNHAYHDGEYGPRIPAGLAPLAVAKKIAEGTWGRDDDDRAALQRIVAALTKGAPKTAAAKKAAPKKAAPKKATSKKAAPKKAGRAR